MKLNLPALEQAKRDILAHEEAFNMSDWVKPLKEIPDGETVLFEGFCGTSFCIAGAVVLRAGVGVTVDSKDNALCADGTTIAHKAAEILGISDITASFDLFHSQFWSEFMELDNSRHQTAEDACRAIDAFIAKYSS